MSVTDDPKETQYKIVNYSRYLDVSARAGGAHLSRTAFNSFNASAATETDASDPAELAK